MSKRLKTQSNRTAWHWVLGAVVVLAAIAWAISTLWWSVTKDNDPSVANETTTAGFFVSLAALDVEENERAARVLDELVQAEPNEPALWANLAVAKLRLNDLESAKAALDQALSLAPTSRELLRLNAQYLEASGQVAAAIDVLRELHQQWPENIRVAFNLSTLLGQVSSETADEERLKLLSGILQSHPQNLRVRCESARLAATVSDSDSLRNAITWLKQNDSKWSDAQQQQIDQAAKAIEDGNDRQAAVALTFFENLSKPSAAYQRSLDELGILSVTAVGTPVRSFLSLNMPPAEASPADLGLQFSIDASPGKAARLDLILGVDQPGERCSTLLSLSGTTIHIQGSAALPFPGYTPDNALACLAWADLNDDFRPDLVFVGEQGWRVYLADDTEGFTELESPGDLKDQPWKSVWQSDVEADGDLDLFLSDHIGNLRCLQNDGAANLSAMENFPEIAGVIGFREIDFDSDGDIDYVCLDKKGNLTILNNQRGGRFTIESAFGESDQVAPITAITVADLNRNGHFEIVGATQSGQITTSEFDGETWQHTALLESGFSTVEESATKQTFAFLAAKDLDNNGAIDLVLSQANRSGVWLQGDAGHWHSIKTPNIQVTSVVDVDCDGLLDLVGQADHQPQLAINQSSANYQWHAISPQANTSAGDKRINSFGIGGTIEVRSGKTLQSQMIQSSRVHFGLGQHPQIDVARIVWPNGTSQAEFELANGQASVAAQRLKGSCPWVFTYDGTGYRFIKDFLWRSPLGLKINAQETAGVTQTEDRIKLPGESLVPHDGIYDIRITAELWETHFFDSVGLVAVDHPVDTEIFVDECFAPQREPIREVVVGTKTQPLKATFDMEGQSLDETLASNDGAFADHFPLGEYQGVASDHWVEFQFPEQARDTDDDVLLIGHGWIYPTDSSLNVAISQNEDVSPYGLILERRLPGESWTVLDDQLGFPAGKHKDVIITLSQDNLAANATYRLRTNMEIYWDSLRWSVKLPSDSLRQVELPTTKSELRQRGFSKLEPIKRRRPDTPIYRVERSQAIWMDLDGYYTRYGDVAELLHSTDDRYVIMNAGDEIALQFSADETPSPDMKRDFMLIGDGWVKDGDFNTAFSRTVRPLPSHDDIDYRGPHTELDQDPVFQKHPNDWRRFHTRYVSPKPFFQTLDRESDSANASPKQ